MALVMKRRGLGMGGGGAVEVEGTARAKILRQKGAGCFL